MKVVVLFILLVSVDACWRKKEHVPKKMVCNKNNIIGVYDGECLITCVNHNNVLNRRIMYTQITFIHVLGSYDQYKKVYKYPTGYQCIGNHTYYM